MCGIVEFMLAQLTRSIHHDLKFLHEDSTKSLKRGITEDLERFGSVWKNKNWSGGELLFQEIKTFLALRRPKEFLVFLEDIGERLGDLRKVLNEAVTITCQTEETSDLLDVRRRKPFNN